MSASAVEWFRSRLSQARAHLDDAIAATNEAERLLNIATAQDLCRDVTAELYKTQLGPGERGEIERDLSIIRSGLQSLQAHRQGPK